MDLDVVGEQQPIEQQPSADYRQTSLSFREVNSTIKRKRLEASKSPVNVDVSRLNTANGTPNDGNRFKILGLLDIETNESSDNDNNGRSREKPDNVKRPSRNSFCPPIFLHNVNIGRLVEQLEAKSPKIDFKIKNVNKYKSKLYFSDVAVHTEMMDLLREKEVKSYSFTPKEHKQVSLVLRGLYHGSEADDIKAALDDIIPHTIAKVTQFSTAHSKKMKLDTGLFLVSLLPGKSLSDVGNIKYVLRQSVIWETPRRMEQTIQCHRCQNWGHISRNCNSLFKCVKCDKKHGPGECTYVRSEETNPYCVNCESEGHPASWKGCPAYKAYVASRKERVRKAIEEKAAASNNVKRTVNASLYSPGKSFASLFKPQQNTTLTKTSKSNVIEEFMKLACYFMQPEELTLKQQINKFMVEYKNMTSSEAKAEFLRLFHKVKSTYGP